MFYIYLHSTLDTNVPFYIGKGKGRRAYVKRGRSKHWKHVAEKHGYKVDFLEVDLTEKQAIEREVFYISKYGRKDLGKGTLVNFTDGGEGSTGRPMNEHTKKVLSQHNTGKSTSPIQKAAVASLFKGKTGSQHNRSKAVRCIETGKVYGSQSEAQRELKLGNGAVSWSIKYKKPIYGMHFEIAS